MGLMDRDYMRQAPRWHAGEGREGASRSYTGNGSEAAPRAYVVRAQPTRQSSSGSWIGGLFVLLLIGGVIWAAATGHIDWAGLSKMLAGGNGVHVCTTDNYTVDKVECSSDDATIADPSQARLAIAEHDAFVASSFGLTVSKVHSDQSMTQLCTTTLAGAPGDNRVAFHLDQVLDQCGARLQSGATYQVEVSQDTESLGTTTFRLASQ